MLKEQARTEIERIFDNPEAWHVVKNTYKTYDGEVTIDEPILKVEWVADQIIALFPQGEEDGLLSELGICKILGCTEDEYCECRSKNLDGVVPEENDYNEIMAVEACGDFQYAVDIVNAQHALDNQSKQAALKAQMERVITDLTKILNQPTDRYIRLKDCYKYVEQLKTKMDKTELLEGDNG